MSTQRCIYCSEEKDASAFNRDHVLPDAFGAFTDNLPRLHCVCRACNQYFGDHVEIIFHRGSIEAIHRILTGLKPPHEADKLRRDRLSFTVAVPGDWHGVRLEFQVEEDSLVVLPVPQVGFLPKGQSGWIYMTDSELADPSKHLPDDVDKIKLFAPSDAVLDHLMALLGERGLPFHKQGELSPPPAEGRSVLVDHHFPMDLITRRSVTKIAFNYLACIAGPTFALRADFDVIRAFIRQGILSDYSIMQVNYQPILFDDLPTQRQTNGHLLTLDWPGSQDHIVARVSLYNLLTYTVLLTRHCSALWQPLRQGHHFDVSARRVAPLFHSSLIVPPPYMKRALGRAELLARPLIRIL